MRVEDGIDVIDAVGQRLLAQIGGGVDQDVGATGDVDED
jgi:hypothetical protein